MPARQDYRIRQVAGRAEVSERTARRWRDTGDERWTRYLDIAQPPFQGREDADPAPILDPELDPFEKIANNNENGSWNEPKSFTKAEAVSALDELMCYVFRLSLMLGREPVIFDGIEDTDWKALDRSWRILERLAIKYNGGPLAHRIAKK